MMTSIPVDAGRTGASATGGRSPLIVMLGGYFALVALVTLIGGDRIHAAKLFSDTTQLPFRAIVLLLAHQAMRASEDPEIAAGWRWLTFGQACGLVGDLSWVASDATGAAMTAPVYLLWVIPYTALHVLGLMTFINAHRTAKAHERAWLDAAVIVTAGCIVAWYLLARRVAQAELGDRHALILFFVTSASNIVIVFLVVATKLRRPGGLSTVATSYLALSFAITAVADIIFEGLEYTNTYGGGGLLDLSYAGATMLLAMGADAQRRARFPDADAPHARHAPSDVAPRIATAVALVPLLLEAVRLDVQGNPLAGIAIGLALLTVLVLWRQRLASTEIESLVRTRIHLEQQLWQAQKMDAVGRLAGGIAHDFNNILASISSHAQLLRTSGGETRGNELEEIEFAAQRAAALTRRLLAFSRTSTTDVKPVPLTATVKSMEPMLARLLVSEVSLAIDVDDQDAWVALADGQLEQVLLNLAINARDAMPTGGHLSISTRRVNVVAGDSLAELGAAPGRWAAIIVRDDGMGMDANTKARLFEPFFTTKTRERGTGLGLATVAGIVTGAGGRVLVDSHVGHGTTMTVLLAFAPAPPSAGVPTPVAGVIPGTSNGITILVVDDEAAIRRAIARFFARLGYVMVEAPDAPTALAELESRGWQVDLVLTDVEMPGMSGLDLGRQIRLKDPSLPILYMSGYIDAARHSGGSEVPVADDTVMKPFDFAVLVERVRDAVRGTSG